MLGVGDGGSDHIECSPFGTAPGAGSWSGSGGTGGAGALAGTGMGASGTTLITLEPEFDLGDAGDTRLGMCPLPGDFTLAFQSKRGGGLELYSSHKSSLPESAHGFLFCGTGAGPGVARPAPFEPLPLPELMALTGTPFPLGVDGSEGSPPGLGSFLYFGSSGGGAFVVFCPKVSKRSTRELGTNGM